MKVRFEFLRFLIGGALNTALTWSLYLALLHWLPYLWAYTGSYVAGIVLSLVVNARFVFGTRVTLRTVVLYPGVYLVQYAVGVVVVAAAVRWCGIPEAYAPIAAVVVTVPVTFLLSRCVLRGSARRPQAPAQVGS